MNKNIEYTLFVIKHINYNFYMLENRTIFKQIQLRNCKTTFTYDKDLRLYATTKRQSKHSWIF